MKVLVVGGAGMLGHKAFEVFRERFDTYVTFREPAAQWAGHPLFGRAAPGRVLGEVHAERPETLQRALEAVHPDVVLNSVGIVKQRDEAKMAIPSILVNALLPHRLAELCGAIGARLFHVSTDCVFSGRRGGYTEDDLPDPVDVYGRSKLLGELDRPGCLTLRTSIVGWELRGKFGLVEWFAAQRHRRIRGYRRAIYTGFSTSVLAGLIAMLIEQHPGLSGLYQAASRPINKYDLLTGLRDALGWNDIEIEPDDAFVCDRSLIGRRFEEATGWTPPGWDEMIRALAAEWTADRAAPGASPPTGARRPCAGGA